MATAALSIGAPDAATSHAASVAPSRDIVRPANDTTPTRWTDDPRARLLLASCVAYPPKLVEHQARYGRSTDWWTAYTGYRAEALAAIHAEHGERVHAAYMAIGDAAFPAFDAWCREPRPTDAIDAVLHGEG